MRRSFVNAVGGIGYFISSYLIQDIVEVSKILLSAIQPVAINQLAFFLFFSFYQDVIPIIPHRTMCGAMTGVNLSRVDSKGAIDDVWRTD